MPKLQMFSPLRNKLLGWFLIFTSLSIFFMLAIWFSVNREKQYREVLTLIGKYEKLFYKDINAVDNFLYFEASDTLFYIKGGSENLIKHKQFQESLITGFDKLNNLDKIKRFPLNQKIVSLKKKLHNYDSIISLISTKTFYRGFKDYGLVGKMRQHAHLLEEYEKYVDQRLLLNMRRREKDYFLRFEKAYVVLFREIGNKLNHSINSNPSTTLEKRKILNNALYNYMNIFDKIVQLDQEIGAHSHTGLALDYVKAKNNLQNYFGVIVNQTTERKEQLSNQLQFYFITISFIMILISIIASIFISKKITDPLRDLSKYINEFIKTDFRPTQDYRPLGDKNEVGRLSRNFYILKQEIEDNIQYFQEKVNARTAEIMHQKTEIENQKEEIRVQRDVLQKTNSTIVKQKEVLEVQNKNIISSIKYAERIQSALLANIDSIKQIWEESFVFIQPKDIVSGDFYFIDSVRKPSCDQIVFTAIDCTGHGVPGALMSILSYNSLKQTIKEFKHTNPLFVVSYMNKFIYEALHNNASSNVQDGLDMAYVVFTPEKEEIEFIGIQMPLYIIRKGEIIEYKGSKMMLGYEPEIPKRVTKEIIKVEKGDMVYLFSDGYADQFGGASGKKFKKKQFKQLLKAIAEDSVTNQRQVLSENFEDWRGTCDQIDDVLVMGFRV